MKISNARLQEAGALRSLVRLGTAPISITSVLFAWRPLSDRRFGALAKLDDAHIATGAGRLPTFWAAVAVYSIGPNLIR